MRAQMNQADAGDDLMRAALQLRQHPLRLGQIARLAKNFAIQKNQRVRAQHERIGNFFGDGARLAMGVELAKFQRRQVVRQKLPSRRWERLRNSSFNCRSSSARRGDAEARMSGGSFTRPI